MSQRMRIVSIVAMLSYLGLIASGCATMFHGSTETIHVRSEQADTRFFLNNRDLGKGTSAVTSVAKKDLSKSILRAEKVGCQTKTSPIETQFDAISLLGILIDFGIISILVIDWGATGAVTKASQTDFVLTPECPAAL